MTWRELGNDLIGKGLPILGNVLLPGIGGTAGAMLAKALGVDATPDAVGAAVAKLDPAEFAKLQEMEEQYKESLLQLGFENDKLYFQDVESARQRETDIVKATGKKDVNLYVLAWSIVMSFFALCGMLMFVSIPAGQNSVVMMLFGGLGAGFTSIIGYFFGSSKGSSEKNQLLHDSVPAGNH